jgi:HEAT repeat protein
MIYSAIVRIVVALVTFVVLLFFPIGLDAQVSDTSTAPPEQGEDQPDWIQSTDTQPDSASDWIQPGTDTPTTLPIPEQALTTLRAQAFRINIDSKSRVLSTLRVMLQDNRLGPDDGPAVELISFLATEAYDFQIRQDGRVTNDFPMIRAEAVQLLGSVGGPAATVTLQRVLKHEEDGYVLSRAVTAVAQASPEPSPELLSTLTALVNHMNAVRRPDNALAMAVINAVEDLHVSSKGIDDPDLFRALISIAQGGYSTAVRRAAVRVIDILRQQPSN